VVVKAAEPPADHRRVSAPTTFRLPGVRLFWALWIGLGLMATAVVAAMLPMFFSHDPTMTAGFVVLGVVEILLFTGAAGLTLRVGVRGVRSGVTIEPGGVTVVNTMKTYHYSLDEVRTFETAPWVRDKPDVSSAVRLQLKTGRTLHLSAFSDQGFITTNAMRKRRALQEACATAMNERLAAVRAEPARAAA
jgi:hypothetical protein